MSVGSSTPLRHVPPTDHTSNLKLRKVALEVLEWSSEDVQFSREGRLLCLSPDFNNWTRRGRSIKMIPVHVVLVTLGKLKGYVLSPVKTRWIKCKNVSKIHY
ncbi:uncharacterized protein LOC143023896 isoform X1 [Oratosquilla oratoria]|uniref:uncharacterized protein LOC143022757 isoform X1 n=1 Tax=Oratosquilla oratoria TaxID=337810 RepID=UPI003F76A4D9